MLSRFRRFRSLLLITGLLAALGLFLGSTVFGASIPNRKPSCKDVKVSTDEDVKLALTLGCTDADNDTLTYELVGGATNGTATVGTDGKASYDPHADKYGTDSFSFRAVDDEGAASSTAVVTVEVRSVNDAPVCAAATVQTREETPLNGTVSCSDVDSPSLTVNAGSVLPTKGSVTVDQSGLYTFVPKENEFGQDSFSVKATDSAGLAGSEATITINIANVEDAPSCEGATPSAISVDEDTTVTFSPVCSDVDGDTLSYEVTGASNGTVSSTDGGFTYAPKANFNGEDTLTVTAADATARASFNVGVTVNAVNDAPVCEPVSISIVEKSAYTGRITCTDVDTTASSLSYSANEFAPAARGMAAVKLDGTFTYEPFAYVDGQDSFGFKVSDGSLWATGTVHVTIAIDDPPVCDAEAPLTVTEDSAGSFTMSCTDDDTDVADLVYKISDLPDHGTAVRQGTSTTVIYTPNANYNGTDSVSFFAMEDESGDPGNTVKVDIVVAAEPDEPTCDGIDPLSMDEDAQPGDLETEFAVACHDGDGDEITISAQGAEKGTVAGDPETGKYTYIPKANLHGDDSFTVTASDGVLTSEPRTVTVAVASVNDAPECSTVARQTIEEDQWLDLALNCNDNADENTPNLSYSVAESRENGEVTDRGNQEFRYFPRDNFSGDDDFTIAVSDQEATTNVNVSVSVTEVPDAPVCSDASVDAQEDVELSSSVTCIDPDSDEVSYVLISGAANGDLDFSSDGTYSYTGDANYSGADAFSFKAKDSSGMLSAETTITIDVQAVNDAPVCSGVAVSGSEDNEIVTSVSCTDVDEDELTYSLAIDAENGTPTVAADGAVTYRPVSNFNGRDSFQVRADDGTASDTMRVTVNVSSVNDAPLCVEPAGTTTQQDTAVTVAISCSDVDGDALTLSAGPASRGTVSIVAEGVRYAPEAGFFGSDSFTATATDGSAASTPVRADITVTQRPAAPVTQPSSPSVTSSSTSTSTSTTATVADTSAPAGAVLAPAAPRLARLIAKGLPITTRCSEACRINVRMTLVNRTLARRLGLAKASYIGAGSARLAAAGTAKPVVRLTRRARAALRKVAAPVRVRLQVTRTDAAGNRRVTTLKIRLR